MSEKTEVNHCGMSAFGLLGIIFVVCKIFAVEPIAAWSWWWVTLPFWGGLALVLAIVGGGLLVALLIAVFSR